jgi:AcrR family transcriptional regulator
MTNNDKRSDVMQAALEIIAENGFHNALTSLIAEKAGVGMGTIYRYFKSKDDLIHAIYNERLAIARQTVRIDYDKTEPLKTRHLKLCRNLFDYMVSHPLDYSFYEQYSNSPYCQTGQMENLQAFEKSDNPDEYPFLALLREGQKNKTIKGLQFRLLFALTASPMFTLIGQTIAGILEVSDDELEQTFSACWDAIANR